MDLSRALGQLADIHQQLAKGEIYRGYRSVPVAASGLIGFAAAWAQAPGLGAADPDRVCRYWTVIAACAALVGVSEIIYNYIRDGGANDAAHGRSSVSFCRAWSAARSFPRASCD